MAERERPTRHQLSLQVQRKGLKDLLETSSVFRKFVWTIFDNAYIFYPTYSRGSPHDTSHQEGRRALGLEMLHLLKHVRPDILSLIEREGNLLAREIEAAALSAPEDDYVSPISDADDDDAEGADGRPGTA